MAIRKGYNFTDNGSKARFHSGHIHYKDRNSGEFKRINTKLKFSEKKRVWTFNKHSFRPFLPEYADGWIKFRDLYHEKDQTVSYRAIAQHVKGKYFKKLDGVTEGNGVIYKNAFGKGVDLILYFSRNSLKKVVRVKREAKSDKDLTFDFELDVGGLPVYRAKDKNIQYELNLKGKKLFDTQKQTLVGVDEKDDKEHFTFLRTYYMWDSNEKEVNRQVVPVEFREENGKLFLKKTIPASFQRDSQGDIFTDTVTSYYAGAGDGTVGNSNSNYSTMHTASTGNYVDYTTAGGHEVNHRLLSTTYYERRMFFPIDTSGLPDTAVISSAELNVYGDRDANADTDTIVVVATTQASTSSLVTGDFDQQGTTSLGSKALADISTTPAYIAFTLNSTGRDAISLTGTTKIGLRTQGDINASTPTGNNSIYPVFCSEETGTSKDPYLEVTYTTESPSPSLSPSLSPSASPSPSSSVSASPSLSPSASPSPSSSESPSPSLSPSASPSPSSSPSASESRSPSASPSPSSSVSASPSLSPSASPSPSSSISPSPSLSPSASPSPSSSESPSPSASPSPSSSPSLSPSSSESRSVSATPSESASPSLSPSLSPSASTSPSSSISASESRSPSASPSPSSSVSASESPSPSASESPSPSLSPSLSPSASVSPSPSASPSLSPSSSESPSPSASPSLSPSASESPSPSLSPSSSESPSPSSSVSPSPSSSVSPSPSPAFWVDKYSDTGNTYSDKYSDVGNSWEDKYTEWD